MEEEKLYFMGKDIETLNKEELLNCVRVMAKENKKYMDLYFNAEKSKIDYMYLAAKK